MIDTFLRPDAPVSPKAEATRSAIIETAEQLFRTLGYQKTTVADIARALHMSPANVYRFFPSKTAINEAIAARLLSGFGAMIWSMARRPDSAEARIRGLFKLLQQQTIALFFNEKKMHDMVEVALRENWDVIEPHVRSVDTAFRHVIMDGQTEGVFARCDPDQAARLVHATTVLFTHPTLIQQKCSEEDLPALADAMAEFVLQALRNKN